MTRPINQKGFTLIELIVTIAIIGIISIPLMGLFTASMKNNVASRTKTSTGAAAQSFMEYYKKNISSFGSSSYYHLYNDGNKIPGDIKTMNAVADTGTFDSIIGNFSSADVNKYNYLVKVVIAKDSKVANINVIVWDKTYKESSKVNLVSLRGN